MIFKMKHFLLVAVALATLTGNVKASDPGVVRGYLEDKGEQNDFARRMSGYTESPFQSIKRRLQVLRYMDEDPVEYVPAANDGMMEEMARPKLPQFFIRPSVGPIMLFLLVFVLPCRETLYSYHAMSFYIDCLSSFRLHTSRREYDL